MMKRMMGWLLGSLVTLSVLAAEPVNINSASAQEIAESLNGVGLSKAEKIVEYRQQNGPFQHIDELVNVKGIGLRTVDRNRDMILLEGPSSAED